MKRTIYPTERHSIARVIIFLLSIVLVMAGCTDTSKPSNGGDGTSPVITTQPKSDTVTEGTSVRLSVAVTAVTGVTLTYQWKTATKGTTSFTDVAGATNASYATPALSPSDSGVQYRVVVTATNAANKTNSIESNIATISVRTLNKIVWTRGDGTKQYADIPANGILLSSTLTDNKTDIKSVDTIPSKVTSIGADAFKYCSNLTSINIPNSVRSMGSYAFAGCTALANVTISNSITSIADALFYGCANLRSITIPSGVTSIGSWAFQSCAKLTSITIPSSVTSMGNYAFASCPSLTSVRMEGTTPPTVGVDMFDGAHASLTIRVPEASVSQYRNAANWSTYESRIYGYNESRIVWTDINGAKRYARVPLNGVLTSAALTGDNAEIASVDTIPNIITSIGDRAFASCSGLVGITLPNSVTSIGDRAFASCSGLVGITLPNSVTSMGDSAFFGCSSLVSITLPNSVTSMGEWVFAGCSVLTSITLPNSVTNIGGFAFYDCSSLTSITLPNSVTNIGNYAFSGCMGLASITLPNSVTNIGNYAFEGCMGLASVRVEATQPPTAGRDMFESIASTLSITVPSASVDAYKGATHWSTYANQITGH